MGGALTTFASTHCNIEGPADATPRFNSPASTCGRGRASLNARYVVFITRGMERRGGREPEDSSHPGHHSRHGASGWEGAVSVREGAGPNPQKQKPRTEVRGFYG